MIVDKALLNTAINQRAKTFIALVFVLLLSACTGGSGSENATGQTAPIDTGNDDQTVALLATNYAGPPPRDADVQDFYTFFWGPMINISDGCAGCHATEEGAGPTKFLNFDDVNEAFDQALTVVNLTDPTNSEVVQRALNGHNCWSPDLTLCQSTIEQFITNWVNGVVTVSSAVVFTEPDLYTPVGAKAFPETSTAFENGVYDLVTQYCVGCHSDLSPTQQQTPFFAHSNIDTAYEAAKTKIDLGNPDDSRLVVRLRDESHNCWSDCASNSAQMLAAINTLVPPTIDLVDTSLVTSAALRLNVDGIEAAVGGRVETNIIAKYEFKIGSGNVVADQSGVEPLMNLTLTGDYEWLAAWGVQFTDGRAQATVNDSQKLYNEILSTGEYSIEAWLFPANVTQEGPARIINYSGGDDTRNFTLGQTLYNYNFLNRSSVTDGNGSPMLSTADADEDLQARLQHVVVTYDPLNGRQVYVDGEHTGDADAQGGGTLNSWDNTFAFMLGNELSGNHTWEGAYRFVAVYKHALSPEDIQANFDAGVGQKYYMLFRLAECPVDPAINCVEGPAGNLTELTNNPNSYIVFEVSQYDNYGYLFSNPYYLRLGDNADQVDESFVLQGLRLGINGKVLDVGQAYANLDVTISDAQYDAETGQPLSAQGMVVPLENGADLDQFFISFDRVDTHTNVFIEAQFDDPVFVGSDIEQSDLVVRRFSEIRESFAQITGVSSTNSNVRSVYDTVVQQLPVNEGLEGFLSSHQMGVTQLAIAYCDVLIEDNLARDALGFSLDEVDGATIDDANAKSVVDWDADFIDPMINAAVNSNVATQPDFQAVKDLIHHLLFTAADGVQPLMEDDDNNPLTPDVAVTYDHDDDAGTAEIPVEPDGLARCSGGCPDGRTASAAKAACAAVLGSSVVTFQ